MEPRTVCFTGVYLIFLMTVTGTLAATNITVLRHVYHFLNIPKTWHEAQNFCRVQYTDLATIDDMEEYKQLKEGMVNAGATFLWIGLEKSATFRWVWSEGIGKVDVYTWDKGLTYEDCVIMHPNGFWYTRTCSNLIASLCFKYDSDGKIKYFLNTTPLSWRDAQAFCRRYYTDLVSVKTTTQNIEIRGQGSSISRWIGAYRDFWMWSDSSTTSFRNWANPNDSVKDENCGVVRKDLQYLWDDNACHHRFAFACYGEHKMRKTVVKVRISSEVNLNLPAESDSLLKQVQAWLEEQGVTAVKIRWLADNKQQIFHHKQDIPEKQAAE